MEYGVAALKVNDLLHRVDPKIRYLTRTLPYHEYLVG